MRLLLTGADGFTGTHLTQFASNAGFEVVPLQAPLEDSAKLHAQVKDVQPTHVIHLAAISHVTHDDHLAYYQTNLLGSLDFLEALSQLAIAPQKVILASSANVYGNAEDADQLPILESQTPAPVNHYAMSKLAMELLARNLNSRLPIVTARPFNYTGVGQSEQFLLPKIMGHFKRKEKQIELGNLDVWRDFSDVRAVVAAYVGLIQSKPIGQVFNVCSGQATSLEQVLAMVEELAGYSIEVSVNLAFVRPNEVKTLIGSADRLKTVLPEWQTIPLRETLAWMLKTSE